MKKFFTLLLLMALAQLYAQEKSVPVKDSIKWVKATCENGLQQAKSDFAKGLYICNSYGLVFQRESPEFITFLENYRKRRYGIVGKNAGCVVTDYSECYSKTMQSLVFEKFGSDIFEKSKKEAKELYAKKN